MNEDGTIPEAAVIHTLRGDPRIVRDDTIKVIQKLIRDYNHRVRSKQLGVS